ncbi:spindle assembly abnormal protein 6 homolog [Clavelina lepadiformis]|uniref:spindle assembly abnormal protein 6 homolog n=1 Tax=Clavelina lepadiformis TaxID=159417 RepID=UPI004041BB62
MTETLYSEFLRVQFKSHDAEDRQVSIKITVELQTTTSPLHRKDLLVRLTDGKDPFFLYTLCLGEEDFQCLKTQQGLLVDFSAFPQRFIALLEQCHAEEKNDGPKFLLQFVMEDGLTAGFGINHGNGALKVIETNPFKHLTHLTLSFIPGTDSDVKKYLASCLKTTLEKQLVLREKLAATERDLGMRLDQARQQLSSRTRELDNLRSEAGGRSERLASNHARELNMEREKALKMQEEMQQRYDKDKKELDTSYQKTLRQKECRLTEVENINKDLTDRRYRAEATIREQKTKLTALEEEHRRCRADLQQTRRENSSLEAERHNQEKTIQQLKTRVAVMEQELLDKEQLVSRITASLDAAQQQKEQLDGRIAEQQTQIKKLEGTIKTMSDEILKGNEIIKRLQDELRGYMAKVKLKNEVTTRQENVLREKEQMYEKNKSELEEKTKALQTREDDLNKLKEQLEAALSKLEESKGLLKTNENVINWLNKQLNERQISSRRNPPPPSNPPLPQHNSLPTFEQHHVSPLNAYQPTYKQQVPNYSTPIGGTAPQPPHLSVTSGTPVSAIGSSPQNLPTMSRGSSTDAGRIPRPSVASVPQVVYKPGKHNKENQSPNAASGEGSSLDPKYFARSNEVITVRSLSPAADTSPPKEHAKKPPINPATRLSQQVINKASVPRGNVKFQPQRQNEIVSAYFSGTKPKPT